MRSTNKTSQNQEQYGINFTRNESNEVCVCVCARSILFSVGFCLGNDHTKYILHTHTSIENNTKKNILYNMPPTIQ